MQEFADDLRQLIKSYESSTVPMRMMERLTAAMLAELDVIEQEVEAVSPTPTIHLHLVD